MSKFLSKKFDGIHGYVLGEQPKDRKYIKLNTNESPYPPSPKVLLAMTDQTILSQNLYADPHNTDLTKAISEQYHVETDQIFTDGGSDVILSYIILCFNETGIPLRFPDITYNFYKVCASTLGIDFEEMPLNEDFSINMNDYINCGRNIIIANPNAPTGLVLSPKEIEQIVSTNPDHLVVIDEAYVDFGNETCIPLVHRYDNIIVVHTASKSRNLAGARVGYAISAKEVVADLNAMRASFNPDSISTLSQVAGTVAVQDDAYMHNCTQRILKTRSATRDAFLKMGFAVTDSHANFLFLTSPLISASEYTAKLREHGVLVRYFALPKIDHYVRITIGTDEQMEKVIQITRKILHELESV
jgi:histidinol-phosphate aminotransferase